jgi:dihydrodipicolinate synthase/N-acetylneuraminate lyase
LEEANKIQQALIKLNTHLASHGGLPAFKAVQCHFVVDVGNVRLPLKPISEEAKKTLISGWPAVRLAE